MRPNDILKEIEKLELSEKLILIENIWDSITHRNHKLPMPEWKKLELKNRYELFQRGDLKLHDWKTAHEDIRKKHR